MTFNLPGSPFIYLRASLMLAAIQLNDELSLLAHEISDEPSYWNLAAKLVAAELPRSNPLPEHLLRICGSAPE